MSDHLLQDFDMAALHHAIDAQRRTKGLSWARATREINRPDARPVLHPVSSSSVKGTGSGRGIEGNVVLQILQWLDRTPESFVPNHPAPSTPHTQLPRTPPDRHLRWDAPALYAALRDKRQEQALTWKQVAEQVGGCTPAMLTGLATARHLSMVQAMRITAWLDRPAADFVALRVLRSPCA
jgi:hypothetical protein